MIDLVMIGSVRQELIKEHLDKARGILGMVSKYSTVGAVTVEPWMISLLKGNKATCLLVFDSGGETLNKVGACSDLEGLASLTELTLGTGLEQTIAKGFSWWEPRSGKQLLQVSVPLIRDGKLSGAAAIEMSLEDAVTSILNTQRIFFVYFLVNILVLTLAGFYSLYMALVKPINRLVATAEKFTDEQAFFFRQDLKDSEFNKLYRSLNTMLNRINDDRTKLRDSVASLEATNRELSRAHQEIVRAESLASVGRLSAGVAHEIGNPIGIVIGYLELLKNDRLTGEQRQDFLRRAESEVTRVKNIIRQLLDFARQPEADEPVGHFDPTLILDEVISLCTVHPQMAGIEVTREYPEHQCLIMVPAAQMKQVLLNMIINAADAVQSGPNNHSGRIGFRVYSKVENSPADQPGLVCIEITDNGVGIDAEHLPHIFDPFFTTKDPGQGTGLGLSICYTLIENLGGLIRVTSTSGMGTTFIITLPGAEVEYGSHEERSQGETDHV